MSKTWFITGASRGFGVEIGLAALRAGHRVVATGRQPAVVEQAYGMQSPDAFLALELDVTNALQIRAAVETAVKRFGTIDVLVNNAGYGHLGFFEETSDEDVRAQFDTNIYGVLNVTRAVLPSMRAARWGHIFNLSSVAGVRGNAFGSLYSTSKFAVEGFSESLAKELAPFNITVTIVEPGPFRTDFLTRDSLKFGGEPIRDYDERRDAQRQSFEQRSGKQPGNPRKLGEALVHLAEEPQPPMRFLAGAFAVETAEKEINSRIAEITKYRALSVGTDGN